MHRDIALPVTDASAPRWHQLLVADGLWEQAQSNFPDLTPLPIDKNAKVAVIREALDCLTEDGQTVELRVLGVHGKRRTDSGYFSDWEKLARAAASYEGRAEGIYFTLNPVNPSLLSRANNRVKEYAGQTTSDADILKRVLLPIDFDPVRPSGISATDLEKQLALERAWACRIWLMAQGWPEPTFADSGNGAHLIYGIDLPNDGESADLIKRCLSALSALFSDAQVKVDTSTGNASRIFKLYGTLARKGDPTPERPHRRAMIHCTPQHRTAVSREQLEWLAAQTTASKVMPESVRSTPIQSNSINYGRAALEKEVALVAATQAGNRNNQLFKSAAALFSLVAANVLNEAEVWQALLSAAQTIGLAEPEARRTIQSGADHGYRQPRLIPKGTSSSSPTSLDKPELRLAEVPVEPVSSETHPTPASKPAQATLMHVDALDTLPPIRWLIKDYLPEDSLVEVYGAPSTGKTQVVFDMAQTLAASGRTVIYVIAEGLRGYRSRKKAWQQFRKQAGGELYLWPEPVQLFETQAIQQFIAAVQSKRPALVVFDTLSRCSLGADENNQKDMGFILEALDTVRRETGATVVAIHHTNAGGSRERGSTVIRGGMDMMLEVSKEDDLIAVSCAKVKDSAEFDTVFFKSVLVDIGEEAPVPVLVPAEKRVQTQSDKLSSLQLDILRAVGMEMFKVSGIKSSQLDEILPPGTKRASKYYSLNNLIRLGYVAPHEKGDPYQITDAGRLKLSHAENATLSIKSNLSNSSPTPFLWTLPESCPMSSPIPHTSGCGIDWTLDNRATEQTTDETETASEMTFNVQSACDEQPISELKVQYPALSELDIARYAEQVGVRYPTLDGAELYQIAEIVPLPLREAFEAGLGNALASYRIEVEQRGQKPQEKPIPDLLALYLKLGFVSTADLLAGYKQACQMGHQLLFLDALKNRNTKAIEYLTLMLSGQRLRENVVIQRLPRQAQHRG